MRGARLRWIKVDRDSYCSVDSRFRIVRGKRQGSGLQHKQEWEWLLFDWQVGRERTCKSLADAKLFAEDWRVGLSA